MFSQYLFFFKDMFTATCSGILTVVNGVSLDVTDIMYMFFINLFLIILFLCLKCSFHFGLSKFNFFMRGYVFNKSFVGLGLYFVLFLIMWKTFIFLVSKDLMFSFALLTAPDIECFYVGSLLLYVEGFFFTGFHISLRRNLPIYSYFVVINNIIFFSFAIFYWFFYYSWSWFGNHISLSVKVKKVAKKSTKETIKEFSVFSRRKNGLLSHISFYNKNFIKPFFTSFFSIEYDLLSEKSVSAFIDYSVASKLSYNEKLLVFRDVSRVIWRDPLLEDVSSYSEKGLLYEKYLCLCYKILFTPKDHLRNMGIECGMIFKIANKMDGDSSRSEEDKLLLGEEDVAKKKENPYYAKDRPLSKENLPIIRRFWDLFYGDEAGPHGKWYHDDQHYKVINKNGVKARFLDKKYVSPGRVSNALKQHFANARLKNYICYKIGEEYEDDSDFKDNPYLVYKHDHKAYKKQHLENLDYLDGSFQKEKYVEENILKGGTTQLSNYDDKYDTLPKFLENKDSSPRGTVFWLEDGESQVLVETYLDSGYAYPSKLPRFFSWLDGVRNGFTSYWSANHLIQIVGPYASDTLMGDSCFLVNQVYSSNFMFKNYLVSVSVAKLIDNYKAKDDIADIDCVLLTNSTWYSSNYQLLSMGGVGFTMEHKILGHDYLEYKVRWVAASEENFYTVNDIKQYRLVTKRGSQEEFPYFKDHLSSGGSSFDTVTEHESLGDFMPGMENYENQTEYGHNSMSADYARSELTSPMVVLPVMMHFDNTKESYFLKYFIYVNYDMSVGSFGVPNFFIEKDHLSEAKKRHFGALNGVVRLEYIPEGDEYNVFDVCEEFLKSLKGQSFYNTKHPIQRTLDGGVVKYILAAKNDEIEEISPLGRYARRRNKYHKVDSEWRNNLRNDKMGTVSKDENYNLKEKKVK